MSSSLQQREFSVSARKKPKNMKDSVFVFVCELYLEDEVLGFFKVGSEFLSKSP